MRSLIPVCLGASLCSAQATSSAAQGQLLTVSVANRAGASSFLSLDGAGICVQLDPIVKPPADR